MSFLKIAVGGVWIVCIAALFSGVELLARLAAAVIGLMVVAHAIECVVFLRAMRQAPGSLAGHLFQTFLFGFVHVQRVRTTVAGPGPGGSQ